MLKCKNCGNPLPSDGAVCKFCGVAIDASQIIERNKYKTNEDRIVLLSEKYGRENKIEYSKPKENKFLGFAVIIIVLIILITLTILINI